MWFYTVLHTDKDNILVHGKYCMLDIICYVKFSQFSVSVPICGAIISLFGIFSDRILNKINICCCEIFTVALSQQNQ